MVDLNRAAGWYDQGDPVHGFDHVLRVMRMAEGIGEELGADLDILRAAALLHDAASAHPEGRAEGDHRMAHEQDSADFARQQLGSQGWSEERIKAVEHCIRSHRFRGQEKPETLEAQILFDADKLDSIGAFGIARTIGYAVQAGQPIFSEPSPSFLASGQLEPGEPHSAYHEYLFKLSKIPDRLYTEPARRIAADRVSLFMGFFRQLEAEAEGL